jgi:hypothetical protein
MENGMPSLEQKKSEELHRAIERQIEVYRRRYKRNYIANFALVLLGVLLGFVALVVGLSDNGKAAGILGLSITLLIALQSAFNFGEKAQFYRIAFTESENLLTKLDFKVHTRAEFLDVLDEFITLKKYAVTNLPTGRGMEVVKEIYAKHPDQK